MPLWHLSPRQWHQASFDPWSLQSLGHIDKMPVRRRSYSASIPQDLYLFFQACLSRMFNYNYFVAPYATKKILHHIYFFFINQWKCLFIWRNHCLDAWLRCLKLFFLWLVLNFQVNFQDLTSTGFADNYTTPPFRGMVWNVLHWPQPSCQAVLPLFAFSCWCPCHAGAFNFYQCLPIPLLHFGKWWISYHAHIRAVWEVSINQTPPPEKQHLGL